MTRLIHSQEALRLDRPMVLVPLEEYESLVLLASRSASTGRKRGPRAQGKLFRLLEEIHREKGRAFATSAELHRHLARL